MLNVKRGLKSWKRIVRDEVHNIKPYIPGKPIKEVKEELGLAEVYKLASNENPLGVSPRVKEVLTRETVNINRYPDGASRSLKRSLSDKLGVKEDMIAIGNGSDGLLKVIAEAFLDNNSQAVISYPSFVEYKFVSQLMGTQLIRVWMKNYHQNLEALARGVTSKTKLIFLTNPHNPAGTIFRKDELEQFLSQIPDDVIVVLDEAYHEFVQDESYPDGIEYVKQGYPVIVLRTFSKAYGLAGLRLGYAISAPDIIETLMKVRDPFNVNHLAEKAGQAALEDKDFLEATIRNNEQGKEYLYTELDKIGVGYVPTQANFVLIRTGVDSIKMFKELLKHGVIVRPGKPLGYPHHLRVSIGLPEENEAFIRGLKLTLE
ncbi:histidinol-phosphate transaminase [Halothermothrix orenii]|uniref:Histidinol-phosphate aminotransferase n=1 Tax=Halothermothrix orenii (strain H 168 / OCM 544 / DSM 9562) TaxID=373903 RepID=B8D0Y4_HALOH|nr:histidinol-phosphate transaminase [Halothermothrix orenii]ACL68953.1 Histidinol-phosphate transaminase [Halothermothrix orenii H 168]